MLLSPSSRRQLLGEVLLVVSVEKLINNRQRTRALDGYWRAFWQAAGASGAESAHSPPRWGVSAPRVPGSSAKLLPHTT